MRVVGRWDVGEKLKKEEWGKQSKQSSGPIIVELMALKFFFIHVASEWNDLKLEAQNSYLVLKI